ncbi:hypothetical protein C1459_35335 [Klebsiella pneumoniae]|nr:hypothetical protein C1459_35335 [Klebsiella pneumoniae]
MVVLVGLAIDQIAQSGLSSLSVIYYSAQLFSKKSPTQNLLVIRNLLFTFTPFVLTVLPICQMSAGLLLVGERKPYLCVCHPPSDLLTSSPILGYKM